ALAQLFDRQRLQCGERILLVIQERQGARRRLAFVVSQILGRRMKVADVLHHPSIHGVRFRHNSSFCRPYDAMHIPCASNPRRASVVPIWRFATSASRVLRARAREAALAKDGMDLLKLAASLDHTAATAI